MLKISIPTDIQNLLIKALLKSGTHECGGVLMGEHIGTNHFRVSSLTVQKSGTIASFVRGITDAIKAIRLFHKSTNNNYQKFNYLGEWHSHPLFSVQPSSKDHHTMRELVSDPKVGANFVVLLIFHLKNNHLEGSAHTYLPDGSYYRSTLDLER
ncbi:Mov34/MPN/PAD-1 family protein [Acinetobacter sp. A47]|uniref:Mov34/MPN/PAD-1 family protein n=1 Tax=Acinetobacter sp. A47 TaxID=1561217 RepID=UPI00056E3353|nr:Mov34/MPN/PAD-1 family protein [Acinetobacter sp. A47]